MKKEKDEGWIQLYNGGYFYFENPRVEDINILDIATSLGNLCRYTGHVVQFYSVAEHSILMSQFPATRELKMWALLHDAPEAYIGDINWPLKRMPYMHEYCKLENNIMNVISEKFQLEPASEPEIVKQLDRKICQDERMVLLPPSSKSWGLNVDDRLGVDLKFMSPSYARAQFLARFKELGGKI